jgi:Siphovirus Gp157
VKLYELASEYERVLDLAVNSSADLDELAEAMESIEAQLEQKCAGIGKVLATLDAERDAYIAEAERLANEAERRNKSAQKLREYVRVNMRDRGITEIKSPLFAFKLINCPPRVDVKDQALVPEPYLRRKVVESVAVDKAAVLKAFKDDGEIVPGTEVLQDVRLQIK